MSMIKLHGIVYFAQIWSLIWCENPFFDDDVQDWVNGFTANELDLYGPIDGFKTDETDFWDGNIDALTNGEKDCINRVINALNEEKDKWLSELGVHPDKAWTKENEMACRGVEPYCIDFRERIVKAVDKGNCVEKVAQDFNVGENLVRKLVAQMLITGYVVPGRKRPSNHPNKADALRGG